MTVRASILSVLTLGPAYGLQLHAEVEMRSARVGSINVGQIYSTLGRLVTAGRVEPAGVTDDGLPLYRLTAAGREEALEWLQSASVESDDAWWSMVRHVLLATTLPVPDARDLVARYVSAWSARVSPSGTGQATAARTGDAAGLASSLEAEAALAWLSRVADLMGDGTLSPVELTQNRPKRGRRPHQSIAT